MTEMSILIDAEFFKDVAALIDTDLTSMSDRFAELGYRSWQCCPCL